MSQAATAPSPTVSVPVGASGRAKSKRVPWLRRALTAQGRSLEITKAGWLFIVTTLAVGFAAINSGANLLHAIFGIQLGLVVASGVLSENMVRRTKARRIATGPVFAETPAPCEVRIEDGADRGDLLSVSIEDDDRVQGEGTCSPVFAVAVPRGGSRLDALLTMPRRGRHRLPPAVVATRFPFGLFVKRKDLDVPEHVLVYPRIDPVPAIERLVPAAGQGEATSTRKARFGEFHSLDLARDGDEDRRIHWPATARMGRLVVTELEAEGAREAWLDLAVGRAGDEAFEAEVSRVASLAVALLREGEIAVGLRLDGEIAVDLGRGGNHERAILDTLALVGTNDTLPHGGDGDAAPGARAAGEPHSTDTRQDTTASPLVAARQVVHG